MLILYLFYQEQLDVTLFFRGLYGMTVYIFSHHLRSKETITIPLNKMKTNAVDNLLFLQIYSNVKQNS